jgi:hypothetical protein
MERSGDITTLTLNRPDARNAIDLVMRRELVAALDEIEADEAARVLVLTGAGGYFCSGGDVKTMRAKRHTAAEGRARVQLLNRMVLRLVDFPRPTIAMVDGFAVGAGSNLALSVDPPAINCDGVTSATVNATVTNKDGDNAADGTDVSWSVQALGTANPLVSNVTAGKTSTTVTPLAGNVSGVTVIADVNGNQASTLVSCAPGGSLPPPAGGGQQPGGGTAGGGGRPTIVGPDTGSGGDLDGAGPLSAWPAVALFVAAMGLVGARWAIRRSN